MQRTVASELEILQGDHRRFFDLLDRLEDYLDGPYKKDRTYYAQAARTLEQLMHCSEVFRDHLRAESALFSQLDRRAGKPPRVHAALEQQRQRARNYHVVLAQKCCAILNGDVNPPTCGLEEAIRRYSLALKAQITFEEYVLYPLVSVFLNDTDID